MGGFNAGFGVKVHATVLPPFSAFSDRVAHSGNLEWIVFLGSGRLVSILTALPSIEEMKKIDNEFSFLARLAPTVVTAAYGCSGGRPEKPVRRCWASVGGFYKGAPAGVHQCGTVLHTCCLLCVAFVRCAEGQGAAGGVNAGRRWD